MLEFVSAAAVAKAVGGAWFVKELFSFFLKLRRQDEMRFYRPDKDWETYCVQKFESISDKLNQVIIEQKIMEVKVNHLEKTIKGIAR